MRIRHVFHHEAARSRHRVGAGHGRKVADRAGGSVEIDSVPGSGTTVALVLPIADHGRGDGKSPDAAVHIADGRVASLIRSLLETAGAQIIGGIQPGSAEIWIVQPDSADVADARAWRQALPWGRLVLFGPPDSSSQAAWRALGPITIETSSDLNEVRAALDLAMNQQP